MPLSKHSELIAVMTELYTLFDDLVAIEPNIIHFPPSDTGVHPATLFDAEGARAAGFAPEAVAVMSSLPYLHDGVHTLNGEAIEMLGSTWPLDYLGQDQGGFEAARELYEENDDTMILPSSFRLTWHNVHGWDHIYDTEQRLVYVWDSWHDDGWERPEDSELPEYLHIQPVSPRDAFQPLIDEFRSLRKMAPPDYHGPFTTDVESLWRPETWEKIGSYELYDADHKLWKAMCKLADLYLECGWDVDAVVQTGFRRAEFIEKRTKYFDEVVKPLDEEESKASDFYRLNYSR